MFLGLEGEYENSQSPFPEENMRKQELVHLHGLLVEITQSLADQGAVSTEIWNDYEALDTNASSIHARKSEHEEAVLLLATSLNATLEQRTDDQLMHRPRNQ